MKTARWLLTSGLGSARASRVDCGASPQSTRWNSQTFAASLDEFAMARAPSPAREARALPRIFRQVIGGFAISLCVIAGFGCESNNYAPPVTPRMAGVGARQHVNVTTLREGRSLFVSRCIECHTLPIIWHYQPSDWSGVVDKMAERSDLKPAERDAIVAYILATRQM